MRAGGNKKGLFTRDRQPKASAQLVRKRYWALAEELDSATPPDDLSEYIHESHVKYLQTGPPDVWVISV